MIVAYPRCYNLLSYCMFLIHDLMQKDYTIFIVGTTAVGKTKLSLQLATLLHSQIIGCDSMQLYKHASIMTAKATKQQQAIAKHNMVDVLELTDGGYNRNMYYEQARKHIDRLHGENKVPIVVGGTNYYLETLLYEVEAVGEEQKEQHQGKQHQEEIKRVMSKTLQDKYQMLREVDQLMANKIHKNDQHRIDSYLKKYITTGKRPSQTYSKHTDKLRNPNTILFWIRNSNRQQLRDFMKTRIESMTNNKQGLVEILSIFASVPPKANLQGGVLQSIGYKQFQSFVDQVGLKIPQGLSKYPQIYNYISQEYDKLDISQYQPTLRKCRQQLLNSTFQYSKRQITWIKNRLFSTKTNNKNFFVLELDGVGPLGERFNKKVRDEALRILDKIKTNGFGSVLGGLPQNEFEELSKIKVAKGVGEWKKYYCQVCKKEMNGELEMKQHQRTGKHKKKMKQGDKKGQAYRKKPTKLPIKEIDYDLLKQPQDGE